MCFSINEKSSLFIRLYPFNYFSENTGDASQIWVFELSLNLDLLAHYLLLQCLLAVFLGILLPLFFCKDYSEIFFLIYRSFRQYLVLFIKCILKILVSFFLFLKQRIELMESVGLRQSNSWWIWITSCFGLWGGVQRDPYALRRTYAQEVDIDLSQHLNNIIANEICDEIADEVADELVVALVTLSI